MLIANTVIQYNLHSNSIQLEFLPTSAQNDSVFESKQKGLTPQTRMRETIPNGQIALVRDKCQGTSQEGNLIQAEETGTHTWAAASARDTAPCRSAWPSCKAPSGLLTHG